MSGSRPEPASLGVRLLLVALLAGAAILFVRGLTVDLPSRQGWRLDETPPAQLARGRAESAWPARYPPLHRDLLVATFGVARAVAPGRFTGPDAERWSLWLLGRGLTVAMALATMLLVWSVARRFASAGAALLAPLAWALAPPVDFLARTMNLDVPYTLWFAASLYAWLELLARRTLAWAVAFAGFGAAAILTKDQAVALYLLPALWWLGSLWREARTETGPVRATFRALLDRRVVVPALVVAGAAAVAYRLWDGVHRLRAHVAQLFGRASDPYQLVPDTVVGQLDLVALTARNVQLATGAITLVAAAAGVVVAAADAKRRHLLTLLLFPLSYYLGFVAPAGYVYDRFLIPVVLVLAAFVPLAVGAIVAPRPRALAAALVACALLAFDGRATLEVSQRAARESRNDLSRLLAAPAFARGRPIGVGREKLMPRELEVLERLRPEAACARLAGRDWLVFEHRWSPGRLDEVERRLLDGSLGYRPLARFGGDAFEALDFTGAPGSNLEKLDLEVVLYRRWAACGPPGSPA